MNFIDAYDVKETTTPPSGGQQSLNEEVSEVMGQLGRFWGGFRKQSQIVLDNAKKDLGSVVSQAQKELSKLAVVEPTTTEEPEQSTSGQEPVLEAETSEAEPTSPAAASREDTPFVPSHSPSTSQPFNALLSRLQASIPPNLVSTVQNHIPETLRTAPANVDFAQIRASLSNELQRVQGLTRAQAEEYVHKSEELLKEAVKEASEFLKDAVKVVPPEEVKEGAVGVVWDGSDMWMLPELGGTSSESGRKGKGKDRDVGSIHGRASSETLRAVATRAESMLKMLRRDPQVVRMDPEADNRVKMLYDSWIGTAVHASEGGMASAEWKEKADKELTHEADGSALKATLDTLVPSEMTEMTFWTRYFFRVYQIEHEEEMRKTLLLGSTQKEEDFSWEDEEDEPAKQSTQSVPPNPPSDSQPAADSDTLKVAEKKEDEISGPSSPVGTPGNSSPRLSSEDSFDVVSSNVSTSGEGKGPVDKKDDDDGDSDWE